MRGLVWGVFARIGRVSEGDLDRLTGAVRADASLGPVARQVSGATALAFAPLQPAGREASSDEPVAAEDGIVADAAIYEPPAGGSSPGEVLRTGRYEELGQFNADFALAAWDGGARRLLLARDRFGVRPLFYTVTETLVAFASLPQALVAAGFASDAPDVGQVASGALGNYANDERSFLRDVRRVRPAHVVEIDARTIRSVPYLREKLPPVTRLPFDEAALELRKRIEKAVAIRVPSDGRIASHLSGGLDSSAIAALAARAQDASDPAAPGVPAYCVRSRPTEHDVAQIDEMPYANAVAQRARGVRLVPIEAHDPALAVRAPIHPAFPVPDAGEDDDEERIAADAAARGIGVILAGYGGNQAASHAGRGAFTEFLFRGRFSTLSRELRAHRARTGRNPLVTLGAEVLRHLAPARTFRWLRTSVGGRTAPEDFFPFVSSREARLGAHGNDGLTTRGNRLGTLTGGNIAQSLDYLAVKGARHGVAYAYPLLDPQVVEFALSLPGEYLLRDGEPRALYRAAMADILPEMVLSRPRRIRPDPDVVLRVAETRDEFRDAVESLRGTAAAEVLDLDRLEHLARSLPSPEDVIGETNRLAAEGRQIPPGPARVARLVQIARFLARAQR